MHEIAGLGRDRVGFIWLAIRPQRLLLDDDGFTVAGGFVRSPKKVLWRNVEKFFVYRLPKGGKLVAYTLLPQARISQRRPSKSVASWERMERLRRDGLKPLRIWLKCSIAVCSEEKRPVPSKRSVSPRKCVSRCIFNTAVG
jgi:hypothetical protein